MAFAVDDFETFLQILSEHPEWQQRLRQILWGEALAELRAEIANLSATVNRLAIVQGGMLRDLNQLKDDVGFRKGREFERTLRERASAIFGRFMDNVRVVGFADVREIRAAFKSAVIDGAQWDDLTRLDALVSGTLDSSGEPIWVAVEASVTAHAEDVARAARRARIIAQAGLRTMGAVVTETTSPGTAERARTSGVALLRWGTVEFWPGAPAN